jgi:hypothetical protein
MSHLPGLILVFLSWGVLNPCNQLAPQQAQPQGKSRAAASASASHKKQVRETHEGDQEDERVLRDVSNAASQAASWANAWMLDILTRAQGSDVRKVTELSDHINSDRKSEAHWEESIWTIPNSELLEGESIWQHVGAFVMVEGTGLTMRQRLPKCKTSPEECSSVSDTDKISYVVNAPLDVRSRILTERLRREISYYAAILQFEGKPADDIFVTSWNTAWFDARNIYCRRSPGEKYRDLLGEEQVCK